MDKDRNRDVRLNYGLITRGKLKDIEALQAVIDQSNIMVVYHTVTGERLKLIKVYGENNFGNKNTEQK